MFEAILTAPTRLGTIWWTNERSAQHLGGSEAPMYGKPKRKLTLMPLVALGGARLGGDPPAPAAPRSRPPAGRVHDRHGSPRPDAVVARRNQDVRRRRRAVHRRSD